MLIAPELMLGTPNITLPVPSLITHRTGGRPMTAHVTDGARTKRARGPGGATAEGSSLSRQKSQNPPACVKQAPVGREHGGAMVALHYFLFGREEGKGSHGGRGSTT